MRRKKEPATENPETVAARQRWNEENPMVVACKTCGAVASVGLHQFPGSDRMEWVFYCHRCNQRPGNADVP